MEVLIDFSEFCLLQYLIKFYLHLSGQVNPEIEDWQGILYSF